jgi:hypothetical protein
MGMLPGISYGKNGISPPGIQAKACGKGYCIAVGFIGIASLLFFSRYSLK